MTSRNVGFASARAIRKKLVSKWNEEQSWRALEWLQELLHENFLPPHLQPLYEHTATILKDGVVLCRAMNAIDSTISIKIDTRKNKWAFTSNLENFLNSAVEYGVSKVDLFAPGDLLEAGSKDRPRGNLPQVIACIYALYRKACAKGSHFATPLGPKETAKTERHFTEEVINQGKLIIGGQYGSNKGASQTGMKNFTDVIRAVPQQQEQQHPSAPFRRPTRLSHYSVSNLLSPELTTTPWADWPRRVSSTVDIGASY